MYVKKVVYEDFVNYKKPSMFIGTVRCGGKCCKEGGFPLSVCQNYEWNKEPSIEVDDDKLIKEYLANPITEAIVFGGLEPFEQWPELVSFITALRYRHNCKDDVVIYTGYYPDEIRGHINLLKTFGHIIIKFGRYVPESVSHIDDVLGVELASLNQFARRL